MFTKINKEEIEAKNADVENNLKKEETPSDKESSKKVEETPAEEKLVNKVIKITAEALGAFGTISLSVIIVEALASLVGLKTLYLALILITTGIVLNGLFNYLTTGSILV
jgi:hypothetical protein